MKKKKKKRIIIIVCAAVAAVAVFVLINVFPFLSMNPAKTGEIAGTGIVAVNNGMCSVYLIESSDGYALIDAGVDSGGLAKTLADIGVSPSDIKHIFLTHTDGDHVASLPLFAGAAIYMSEDEMQMIDGRTNRSGGSSNSLPSGTDTSSLTLLKDGQEVAVGERTIKGVKAPGHTPGSMLYIVDDNYLFSGDAFRVSDNKMTVHPFTMDAERAAGTIERLYGDIAGTELTMTAHYGYFESAGLKIG